MGTKAEVINQELDKEHGYGGTPYTLRTWYDKGKLWSYEVKEGGKVKKRKRNLPTEAAAISAGATFIRQQPGVTP